MNIYYFTVAPGEKPETPDNWKIWFLIIPINGKFPKKGDRVLILREELDSEYLIRYDAKYSTYAWPHRFTEEMMHYILRKIFKKLK